MKSSTKKLLAALLAGVMMVSVAACTPATTDDGGADAGDDAGTTDDGGDSADTGEKPELSFTSWANTGEIEVLGKAVSAYNELQDAVTVVFEPTGGDGYETKLITSLAGGTAQDVFYVGDGYIGKLVNDGTIADLTDFMASEDSYVSVDDFEDGMWGAARTADGKIYGISVDCNPRLLYYSPTMFADLGIKTPQEYFDEGAWTVDAWTTINDELNAAGKTGYLFGGDANAVYSVVGMFGGSVWQDDGATYKFDEKAVEALNYAADQMANGNWAYSGLLPEGQGEDASFMSQQAGFIAAGKWQTPTFFGSDIDHDYIPFPSEDGTEFPPQQIHAAYMSVKDASELKEEAMKFATYYCGIDGQTVRLESTDGVTPGNAIPSVLGADEVATAVAVPEHVSYLLDVRSTGWVLGGAEYSDSQYPGLSDDLKALLEEIWVNGETVDTILPQLEEKAQSYIDGTN